MPEQHKLEETHPDSTSVQPLIRGDWVLFHPVYSDEELKAVQVCNNYQALIGCQLTVLPQVVHREPTTFSDKAARILVKAARKGFDLVSGYKEKGSPPAADLSVDELRRQGYALSETQWLQRILFLETVAGVPGMVAAVLRHLRSLRLMVRLSLVFLLPSR